MLQNNLIGKEQYIIDEYNKGRSTNNLATELKCNPGSIWTILDKNKVNIRKRSNNYGTLDDRKKEIISLFNNGNSAYKISKLLSISKPCVLKFLKKNNIDTTIRSTAREDKLVDHSQEIINLYQCGKSSNEIAKLFKASQSNIWKLLVANNVSIREIAKYHVNTAFFDKIDTPEKSYIVGWFMSDGCVDLKGKMRIQLQSEDKHILEQIAKLMEYNGVLYTIPPPKKFPHRKEQTCLCINRKELADKLIHLGCVPNKSLILKFPTSDQIPGRLLSHFVRGFYDGDGGISGYTTSLTSTDIFLKDLAIILKNQLDIQGQLYYRHADKNTANLMFSKRESSKKFLQWIYQDSTIHLTRKYEKAKSLLLI